MTTTGRERSSTASLCWPGKDGGFDSSTETKYKVSLSKKTIINELAVAIALWHLNVWIDYDIINSCLCMVVLMHVVFL